MKIILETSQFRRDIKRLKRLGRDLSKLRAVVTRIAQGLPLDTRHRDHPLTGALKGSRDCHIEPDWILIYRHEGDSLYLERTGSHSELFR